MSGGGGGGDEILALMSIKNVSEFSVMPINDWIDNCIEKINTKTILERSLV